MRFINHAKEQRDWLVCELSGLDAQSEDYQSNKRAIRDSIKELDKVIVKAIQSPDIPVPPVFSDKGPVVRRDRSQGLVSGGS